MTYQLDIDPGKNTGVALAFYDAITPYRLEERWQVHGGLDGFNEWWYDNIALDVDEIVCEKFILARNDFQADLEPMLIEGALRTHLHEDATPIMWQPRTDKSALTGYPETAKTPGQRQRVRFDFLDRFGLFKPGTENDDSNDAITHGLVNLKRRKHAPTLQAYWPMRPVPGFAIAA